MPHPCRLSVLKNKHCSLNTYILSVSILTCHSFLYFWLYFIIGQVTLGLLDCVNDLKRHLKGTGSQSSLLAFEFNHVFIDAKNSILGSREVAQCQEYMLLLQRTPVPEDPTGLHVVHNIHT